MTDLATETPTSPSDDPALPSVRRQALWIAGGVIAPIVAFVVDASLRVDPVLWGGFEDGRAFAPARSGAALTLRQVCIYGLLGLSFMGVVLASVSSSRRTAAAALPLLVVGVVFATVHAVVFLPLIPLSVIASVFLIGLLGFTPYIALAVWFDALVFTARGQLIRTRQPLRWVVLPILAAALPITAAVVPLDHAMRTTAAMRRGGPGEISRGFRRLGPLVPLVREDLLALYGEIDGESQVRMRNLYLERFGADIHDDLPRPVR